jgi:Sulfotransferase family
MTPMHVVPPAPFIVGVGRSGTTLLRLMLDSHPEMTIPPETHFVPDLIEAFDDAEELEPSRVVAIITSDRHWVDFDLDPAELEERLGRMSELDATDALRAFYGVYAEKQGKPRWGDKTPIYVTDMAKIQGALPEARFVHLIRDGRDAALSRAKRSLKGGDTPITRPAELWRSRILKARNQSRKLSHYTEVRYEDLVTDPEPTLRRVCEFIELPFDAAMLTYYERAEERLAEMAHDLPSDGRKPERPGSERLQAHAMTLQPPSRENLGKWKEEAAPEDVVAFEEVAGDLLDELGYEVGRASLRKAKAAHRKKRKPPWRKPIRTARKTAGRLLGRGGKPGGGDPTPAPFVVGVTRSGTTLLRMMLDAHRELTIPPETYFVPDLIKAVKADDATPESALAAITQNRRWGDFHLDPDELLDRLRGLDEITPAEAIRAFYRLYADKQGKPRWGDKTPLYINRMAMIQRNLPEARFVHLIRDGRAAAVSRSKRVLTELPPMEKMAVRWRKQIVRARKQAPRLPHYLELRYEDLVTDPASTLTKVCDFIELPFDDEMLRYHERAEERLREMSRDLPERPGKVRRPADHRMQAHALTQKPPDPSRLDRWREEMSPEDQAAFERVAGDLLDELGYEVEDSVQAGKSTS